MTEKKTFKNPLMVMHYEHGELVDRSISHSEGLGSPHGTFSVNEWDMEVTFTKKIPKLEVGTRVRSKYTTTYTYEVLAQWKDTVIVVDPTDDEIEYFDYDELVIIS